MVSELRQPLLPVPRRISSPSPKSVWFCVSSSYKGRATRPGGSQSPCRIFQRGREIIAVAGCVILINGERRFQGDFDRRRVDHPVLAMIFYKGYNA